jgi:hypothetical protein
VRDRVCILHGGLWPRGHRHDGNVVNGVGEIGVGGDANRSWGDQKE